MRKGRFAEWLLELLTTPERAASTVGDLLESADTSGEVWFWSNVLRTFGSLLWRGIANDPLGMLGLAFRGLLLNFLYLVLFFVGIVVFSSLVGFAYGLLSGRFGHFGIGTRLSGDGEWIVRGMGLAVAILTQFQVGRWVARRAPGRELPACIATIVLPVLIGALICVVALFAGDRDWRPDLNSLNLFLSQAPCILGGMWVRRRQKAGRNSHLLKDGTLIGSTRFPSSPAAVLSEFSATAR